MGRATRGDHHDVALMTPSEDIAPTRLLRLLLVGWKWIILGAFVGAGLGWGMTFIRTPRYEASAVLSIGFDYARVNEMDDPVTNYVVLRVRDLLLSDETMQRAVDTLGETPGLAQIPSDPVALRSQIRLAEEDSRWQLVSWASTPEAAAAIANSWAESALVSLAQAMLHAIRAADLEAAVYRAGCKLTEDPAAPGQVIWLCTLSDGSVDPDTLPVALLEETTLSRGLLPAMSFSLLQRAEPPAAPVLWGRGTLILAGTLLGMWVSILALLVRRDPVGGQLPSSPAAQSEASDGE
ncbi:MAG TPA: hypothetical protein VI729_01130 [Anaerolineales bacterium]|nr:hypothetical protein [Anaerolineales bacterium]